MMTLVLRPDERALDEDRVGIRGVGKLDRSDDPTIRMAIQITEPADAPGAFQSAWNAHDMAAFGALFHKDASFVNRFAHYVRGVDEIVALHRPIHETIY